MTAVTVILLVVAIAVAGIAYVGASIIRDIRADLKSCPVEPKDPKFKTVKERIQ